MNDMTKTVLKGLRHGIFVGMTGNQNRLRAMRAAVEALQRQLSLSEIPDLSTDVKSTKAS
jgi:hypothetical protein